MSLNIEYEDRAMLSEKQYVEILSHFIRENSNPFFIDQTNTYIDTLDLSLKRNHKMLRIRKYQNSVSELTLKIKGEDGDKEYNEILPLALEEAFIKHKIFPDGEIKNLLLSFGIKMENLKIITTLRTTRYEEKIGDCLIVIDKNYYSDIVDYNIEIESSSKQKAHEKLVELSILFNFEYKEKYITKSTRAIQKALFKN